MKRIRFLLFLPTFFAVAHAGETAAAEKNQDQRAGTRIVIHEEQAVVASFFGFGAEWDPKFWTSGTFKTASDGKIEANATEQDWERVQKRIRWMRLPFVRMMMCSRWCTNGDGPFDWQTKHMQIFPRQSRIAGVECASADLRVLAARLPKESGGGWSSCLVNRGPAGAVTLKVPDSPVVTLNRYLYDGKLAPRIDADGFPAPAESGELDLGKGAEVAVPENGVVFLSTLKAE